MEFGRSRLGLASPAIWALARVGGMFGLILELVDAYLDIFLRCAELVAMEVLDYWDTRFRNPRKPGGDHPISSRNHAFIQLKLIA